MKFLFLALFMVSQVSFARVEALFHPHDPTLEKIASWILSAEKTIDISMYNMETTSASPVIQAIQLPEIQKKISSHQLEIRLLFEGYGEPAENQAKMQQLEILGVDCRFLGETQKVHHKFAVIDFGLAGERVISGSANWSLASYRNYNENILFFDQEPQVANQFAAEFERLWLASKSFGQIETAERPHLALHPIEGDQQIIVHFNSLRHLDLLNGADDSEYVMTSHLVRQIQAAQKSLQIATTRIRLKPVLEAVQTAAERGVKIQILISQDDYIDLKRRSNYLLKNSNIELRIKFYNLQINNYLKSQMHNKFMIVDGKALLTGSFNWSNSSEESHIENLIEFTDKKAQEVLPFYQHEFENIWEMGRSDFASREKELQKQNQNGQLAACEFKPTALYADEVSRLLKEIPHCQK